MNIVRFIQKYMGTECWGLVILFSFATQPHRALNFSFLDFPGIFCWNKNQNYAYYLFVAVEVNEIRCNMFFYCRINIAITVSHRIVRVRVLANAMWRNSFVFRKLFNLIPWRKWVLARCVIARACLPPACLLKNQLFGSAPK